MSKQKRPISVDDKMKILREVDEHRFETKTQIAKRLQIPLSTLATIVKNREEIEANFLRAGPSSAKRWRAQGGQFQEMENALFAWFQQNRAGRIAVSGPMLQEKALHLARQLDLNKEFKASVGWLQKFKARHGITGRTTSVDVTSVEHWRKDVLPLITRDYPLRDIYSCAESGLYFNLLPSNTLAEKSDPCSGGKNSKRRITVLLTTNADGSDKLRPLIVAKSQKPRCFKGVRTFPADYYSNTKAWMTRKIFQKYLQNLDNKMAKEKRKILLLLERSAAHSSELQLKNVRIEFFPVDCTSQLQPLELGIVATMKAYYRKHLLKHTVSLLESGRKDNKIDLLKAMQFMSVAWSAVQPITIEKCFRKAGINRDSGNEFSIAEPMEEAEDVLEEPPEWSNVLGTSGLTFEHFVEWDNNLAVCALQSDEAVVAEIAATEAEGSSDGSVSDEEEPVPLPTFAQAISAFELIRRFVYSKDISERDSNAFLECERILYNAATSTRQTKITDYFKNT